MGIPHQFLASSTRRSSQSGAALVIVLCFVVLLTVVVVAFLNHSQTSVQIMNARVAGSQVEQLGRSAIAFTEGDLRQEIIAGSTNNAAVYSVNGQTIYEPTSNLTVPPSRTGFLASTPGTDPTDNIVKISEAGTNFFGPAANYNASYPAANFASAINTSTPALNGRYINGWTTSGWNKPMLVDTTLYSTASLPVPDWIYLTTNSTGRQVLSTATAGVVGRYAYVIYDEGGLLDANVAGYPSTISSPDARDPSRKGPLAMADLSQIPPTGKINVNSFISWRNAAASASGAFSGTNYPSSTAPDYLKYLLNGSINRGFTTIYPGDQKFLSRQDLIAFAEANPSILPTESLAYLGTFTRGLDAPTWHPVTPSTATFTVPSFTYEQYAENSTGVKPWTYNEDSINTRWPTTGTITRPKLDADVDASATSVPTETVIVHQGDPVLSHRFPLSKIALLSNPNAKTQSPATVGSIAWAVKYYFGLQWVTTDATLAEPHWEYVDLANSGSLAAANDISSISDVSYKSPMREPDFFEILREGILRGSSTALMALEGGASIIDEFDSDDTPTAITNASGGSTRLAFGKENLPYFYQFLFWPYRPKSDPTRNTFEAYLVPVFWNPFRNASTVSTTVNNFRITLAPTAGNSIYAQLSVTSPAVSTTGIVNPSTATLAFSTTATTTYQEPTTLSGIASQPAGGFGAAEVADRSGFFLGSMSAPETRVAKMLGGTGTGLPTYEKATVLGTANFSVQYQSGGNWYTYQDPGSIYTVNGAFNTLDSAGANGVSASPSFAGYSLPTTNAPAYYGSISCGLDDPRVTSGVSFPPTPGSIQGIAGVELFSANVNTNALPQASTLQPVAPESTATGYPVQTKITASQSFGWFPTTASTILTVPSPNINYLGMWNENKAGGGYANYLDYAPISSAVSGDSVSRPGDGFWGANPQATLASPNPHLADRSILLNRPFRSVAELGYAYRGLEWRTYDFCSAVSGDSGLLDLFTTGESNKTIQTSSGTAANTPMNAGVLDINTRHPEVLGALLNGSLRNDLDTTASSVITPTQAAGIAADIVQETSNMTAGHGPLLNRSELVNRVMNLPDVLNNQITSIVAKPERESVVRALADSADTRTWNLLVDLDVQLGRYPPSAIAAGTPSALSQFDVQGERRYWLHVAIDRYTGKIIDEQLEVVNDN